MRYVLHFVLVLSVIFVIISLRPISVRAQQQHERFDNKWNDQYIIKYREDSSPTELSQIAEERENRSRSFFGSFLIFIDNFRYKMASLEQPEAKLARIVSLDKEAGVINKEQIFPDSESKLASYYLLTTDGKKEPQDVMRVYFNAVEVEFIEPNNMQSIQFSSISE